jgi:hypothetical protein
MSALGGSGRAAPKREFEYPLTQPCRFDNLGWLAGQRLSINYSAVETSSEKYAWLNRICSIATGSREADWRTFDVFQAL